MKLSPELKERLSAEYALGTLRGPARARLKRRALEDPELRGAIAAWEARLAPAEEASYVAVLSDPKTNQPVLVASADQRGTVLRVNTLDPRIHVAGRSLELWALPRGGKPRSLGVVSPQNRMNLKLVAAADQALGDVPALAISLEPPGGSPTGQPTGPVLYSGPCVKYW